MIRNLLFLLAFSLVCFTSEANFTSKPRQPRYQNSKLGQKMPSFVKRMEFEFGIGAYTFHAMNQRYLQDSTDGNYKWTSVGDSRKTYVFPNVGVNLNFPLAQSNPHQVFGIAFGPNLVFNPQLDYKHFYMNINMPFYLYSRYGAEGSFDSRENYTWGWGLGYVPYYLMTDYGNRLNGMPIAFIEGGKFRGKLIYKFRLTTNFVSKDIYQLNFGLDKGKYNWQTMEMQKFPLRISFIILPFSGSWERNRWTN